MPDSLKAILNASSLVSETDEKGKITRVNEKFCSVSGYVESELIGKDHSVLNSGYHSREFWQTMYQTTVKKREVWSGIVKNKAKDDSFYWVQSYIQAIFIEGKLKGFISVRHDITQEIEQKQKIEEGAVKMQSMVDELKKNSETLREKNEKLLTENEGVRQYNLSMEKLKAQNKLKLTSLVIVMIPIFILFAIIIYEKGIEESKITLFGTFVGIIVGSFLRDLVVGKTETEKNE